MHEAGYFRRVIRALPRETRASAGYHCGPEILLRGLPHIVLAGLTGGSDEISNAGSPMVRPPLARASRAVRARTTMGMPATAGTVGSAAVAHTASPAYGKQELLLAINLGRRRSTRESFRVLGELDPGVGHHQPMGPLIGGFSFFSCQKARRPVCAVFQSAHYHPHGTIKFDIGRTPPPSPWFRRSR